MAYAAIIARDATIVSRQHLSPPALVGAGGFSAVGRRRAYVTFRRALGRLLSSGDTGRFRRKRCLPRASIGAAALFIRSSMPAEFLADISRRAHIDILSARHAASLTGFKTILA